MRKNEKWAHYGFDWKLMFYFILHMHMMFVILMDVPYDTNLCGLFEFIECKCQYHQIASHRIVKKWWVNPLEWVIFMDAVEWSQHSVTSYFAYNLWVWASVCMFISSTRWFFIHFITYINNSFSVCCPCVLCVAHTLCAILKPVSHLYYIQTFRK